jgi:hypothetical protein
MEWRAMKCLLSAEYPLHLLVADVEIGVVVREQPNRLLKNAVHGP